MRRDKQDWVRYLKSNYSRNQLIEKHIEDITWLENIIKTLKQKQEE